MKGKNPFTLFATSPKMLAGRKPEISMYNSLLKEISGKRPSSMLIAGSPGMGKSSLLSYFVRYAEKQLFYSLMVKAGARERTDILMQRILAELGNYLDGLVADGTISNRVRKNIVEKKDLVQAAKTIGRHCEGLMIMIDDVDKLRDNHLLNSLIGEIQKKERGLKLGFVLSSVSFDEHFIGMKIMLSPFDEHDSHEMINDALGKGPPKMGEGCYEALMKDSEANPRILRTMCFVLYDQLGDKEKIITRKHYIVNSSKIMSILSRDFFDPLWQSLPEGERRVLVAFAESKGSAHISDIANKLDMRHATTLALRLEEKGQLIRVDRGIYKVFTKLYGKYAIERS
jgi:hypothetical protein